MKDGQNNRVHDVFERRNDKVVGIYCACKLQYTAVELTGSARTRKVCVQLKTIKSNRIMSDKIK